MAGNVLEALFDSFNVVVVDLKEIHGCYLFAWLQVIWL
jgi:hypothetical protein